MKKLGILQHTLGLNEYGEGTQYRNHFVADPSGDDFNICQQLTEEGLMKIRPMSAQLTGGGICFVVTEAGTKFIKENSPSRPPEPKMTQSQKRYHDYRQSETSSSFSEWMGFDRPRG